MRRTLLLCTAPALISAIAGSPAAATADRHPPLISANSDQEAHQTGAIASQNSDLPNSASKLRELVDQISIPYERFVLPNGLTTIIHTDRKAPVVGVTIYYKVGSRNEPRGRAGFAHLYEHLFFGGSANAPSFEAPLKAAGSSQPNGSTYYDRTNYVETVPTGALELALFLESDRMGWLLPAITQDKLDKQRGVVKNEKRQGDNQAYGLEDYAVFAGLFPVGHPYHHAPIGANPDLEAATLTDVQKWFVDHYSPNNAVLVLSGDIDTQSARPLVEKWFAKIPRGPEVRPVAAGPVTLAKPTYEEMVDRVATSRVTLNWSAAGRNDPDTLALMIGMDILAGMSGSRLEQELVRKRGLAVGVSATDTSLQGASVLRASIEVKAGADRREAANAAETVISAFLLEGPTSDELERAVTGKVMDRIKALEVVGGFGGKGAILAEGEVFAGDPAHYRQELEGLVALTPDRVRSAMRIWLSRPIYELDIIPGERTLDGAEMGGDGPHPSSPTLGGFKPAPLPAARREAPSVAPVTSIPFPSVERAVLSNGIPVELARRGTIPIVNVMMAFDAGYAADSVDTPGAQAMMIRMLREGTASLNSLDLAAQQQRLGAQIGGSASLDTSSMNLTTLTANLKPSLSLMADMIRNSAYRTGDVERIKEQQLAQLGLSNNAPGSIADSALLKVLFGDHPYSQTTNGMGTVASINSLTPEFLQHVHDEWLRPQNAKIFIVGDVSMNTLLPILEHSFGSWVDPDIALPRKNLAGHIPRPKPRIILIDRPNSPQSIILAGRVLSVTGGDQHQEALGLANFLVGGDFLSRLNTDLREHRGWSYGVSSGISSPKGPRALFVSAPVQADKTGSAIQSIRDDMADFTSTAPANAEERDRAVEGTVRSLVHSFETNGQVLTAMERNSLLGRPDSFYEELPQAYRGTSIADINAAAKQHLTPENLIFVVVGDRKLVEPQLRALNLPLEFREPHDSQN